MNYNWYRIFNLAAFEALDLPSKIYSIQLDGVGPKDILVTKGNYVSILFSGVFLSIDMIDKDPFEFDGHAVSLDENGDVWVGVLIED